eukprot:3146815-Rhodomonas_salina.4
MCEQRIAREASRALKPQARRCKLCRLVWPSALALKALFPTLSEPFSSSTTHWTQKGGGAVVILTTHQSHSPWAVSSQMHSPTINQRHGSACSSELAHACRELHGHDEDCEQREQERRRTGPCTGAARVEGQRGRGAGGRRRGCWTWSTATQPDRSTPEVRTGSSERVDRMRGEGAGRERGPCRPSAQGVCRVSKTSVG